MSTAFANVAGVIDAPLQRADDREFPFGANVLSLHIPSRPALSGSSQHRVRWRTT